MDAVGQGECQWAKKGTERNQCLNVGSGDQLPELKVGSSREHSLTSGRLLNLSELLELLGGLSEIIPVKRLAQRLSQGERSVSVSPYYRKVCGTPSCTFSMIVSTVHAALTERTAPPSSASGTI